VAAGSSQTRGGPGSKASAFRPALPIAWSCTARAAHHRRPDIEARLKGLGQRAVAFEITAMIDGAPLEVQNVPNSDFDL
jgi:hypothetical protein